MPVQFHRAVFRRSPQRARGAFRAAVTIFRGELYIGMHRESRRFK
jgi:hypothetical protein